MVTRFIRAAIEQENSGQFSTSAILSTIIRQQQGADAPIGNT